MNCPRGWRAQIVNTAGAEGEGNDQQSGTPPSRGQFLHGDVLPSKQVTYASITFSLSMK